MLQPCHKAATQKKERTSKVLTAIKDLLRQLILNLESTPIQILKHLIWIIFLCDGLQFWEALSLAI